MANGSQKPRAGGGGRRGTAGKAADAGNGGNGEGGEFRSSPEVRTAFITGMTFAAKAVQYAVVDGEAIFEGDIVLGTVAEVEQQTEELREVLAGHVAAAAIITGDRFRWPGCRIPYEIDPALPSQDRVTNAIADWETKTSFRFVLRSAENAATCPDYVTFRPGSGCSSAVGRRGGRQFVTLGAGCTVGSCIHEIGHVVGFWHEQSREDRDAFITINWAKIQAGMEHNFAQRINDGDDVGPYDYDSIMHYPRTAFSVDGSETITPVDPNAQIGQRTGLSAGDVAAANSLCRVRPTRPPKPAFRDVRTRKEVRKDPRTETVKEVVRDRAWTHWTHWTTWRDPSQLDVDPVTEQRITKPADPIKRDVDMTYPYWSRFLVGPRTIGLERAVTPFAVAAPHQAPDVSDALDAMTADERLATVGELDAQLVALDAQLLELEAARLTLAEQYEETAALLEQAVQAADDPDA